MAIGLGIQRKQIGTGADPMAEDIHDEVQNQLFSEIGADARAQLLASCRRRSVAGVFCFRFTDQKTGTDKREVVWAEDLSGELDGLNANAAARNGIKGTPGWLLRWVCSRKRP